MKVLNAEYITVSVSIEGGEPVKLHWRSTEMIVYAIILPLAKVNWRSAVEQAMLTADLQDGAERLRTNCQIQTKNCCKEKRHQSCKILGFNGLSFCFHCEDAPLLRFLTYVPLLHRGNCRLSWGRRKLKLLEESRMWFFAFRGRIHQKQKKPRVCAVQMVEI